MVCVVSSTLEIPKSPIFIVPLLFKKILEVLISRWMIFFSCMKSNAKEIYKNQFNIKISGK